MQSSRPIQPSLFRTQTIQGEFSPPPAHSSQAITATSSLATAIQAYAAHLQGSLCSVHTVKAFVGDLSLLAKYLGATHKLGEVTRNELESFLVYLRHDRGKPCSPKTLNRRVTALKSFFRWLVRSGILKDDPAAELVYRRAVPPLPQILYDEECKRLLCEASKDSRTYLLILLLLEAGLKREEILALKPSHFDLSNPYRPELWISSQGRRRRQRKLRLPPEVASVLPAYLAEYRPAEYLFDCTERNLGYLLSSLAERAGIQKKVSCQILRDTFAVRQLRAGERIEAVLEKLGLAPGSYNEETKEKYLRLARPSL